MLRMPVYSRVMREKVLCTYTLYHYSVSPLFRNSILGLTPYAVYQGVIYSAFPYCGLGSERIPQVSSQTSIPHRQIPLPRSPLRGVARGWIWLQPPAAGRIRCVLYSLSFIALLIQWHRVFRHQLAGHPSPPNCTCNSLSSLFRDWRGRLRYILLFLQKRRSMRQFGV